MPLATSSQKIFLFCRSQGEYRDAAFNLHQATERLYACLLLTLTYYSPYNHRSEEHTSELQSLMRISYAVFCLKKKKLKRTTTISSTISIIQIISTISNI